MSRQRARILTLDAVSATIRDQHVLFAMIGASAMAVHGVARSTTDLDLLVEGIPVVEPADLILLKLYAGGSQDGWDIHQLLMLDADGRIARAVEDRLGALPSAATQFWHRTRADR